MDKKSPKGRKRSNKGDENYWDCSVCTFRNNAEAFKCSMCDVRKGTSTRKPRLNADLVAAQVQQAQALTPPPASSTASASKSSTPEGSEDEDSLHSSPPPPPPPPPPPSHPPEEDPEEESSKEPERPSSSPPGPEEEPSTSKGLKNKERKKKLGEAGPSSSASASATGAPPPKKKYNINPAKLRNVDRSSATYHSVTVNDFTVVITEFKPKIKKEKSLKKTQKKGVASDGAKKSTGVLGDGASSASSNEMNGHEEAMRNNNADTSDSRSS